MEHCKKLGLVPHETLNRFHENPVSRSGADVMGELDTEMQRILLQKAEDSEKWKLYHKSLLRYLHFANEQTKPLEISLPSEDAEANDDTSKNLLSQLVAVIPRIIQGKAITLYNILDCERTKDVISWDSTGLVNINGTPIPQSNIIDLISDAVRSRKSSHAVGWQEFATALKQVNVPSDLISNTKYKDYMRTQKGSGKTYIHAHAKVKPRFKHRPALTRYTETKFTPKDWSRFWSHS